MQYTYSISTDFPNAMVMIGLLTSEVESSAIATTLSNIGTNGDDCTLTFSAALSAGDVTILDGLVAAHSGVKPLAAPTPVIIEPTGDSAKTLVLEGDGPHYPESNSTTNMDRAFPVDIELQGAEMLVYGHAPGDTVNLQVIHPVAGVVGEFGRNVHIPPSGVITTVSEGTSLIPVGLILRIQYISSGAHKPQVYLNYRTWQ